MFVNLFLAALMGVGVFLMVTASAWGNTRGKLTRIERLQQEEERPVFPTFVQNLRYRGLSVALEQAELPVTRAEFLRFGLLIALGVGGVTFALTGSALTPLLVGAGSLVIYTQWLFWRRDRLRLAYEEALADLCDRMATGALLFGTLEGILMHAAQLAPEAVRADFTQIAADLSARSSPEEAFRRIRAARHSQSLDLLLDTLLIWRAHGVTRPLGEILSPLRGSLREMSAERRRIEAELTLPRFQMTFVALAPVLLVILLHNLMPPLAAIYDSPVGSLIQLVAFSIAALGWMWGQRVLARVQKVLEIHS